MKKISENSGRNKIDGFEEYSLRRKKRAIWTAAGCVLAALMVVGISFALRSQGRAYEGNPTCGKEAHTHVDSCYLTCTMDANDHTHGEGCYEPTCEEVPHKHVDDCYDKSSEPICEKDEEGHEHDDSCYLICKMVENNHAHGEGCYKLTCPIVPHTHGDECYDKSAPQCGLHEHDESCYQPTGPLDISGKVTSVEFYTSSSQDNKWVLKNKEDGQYSFSSNDSVKAKFTCSLKDIRPVSQLARGAYVLLPESILLPDEMKKETFTFYDGPDTIAGTYSLSDNNGKPRADFTFDADYLAGIGSNGWIENLLFDFQFKWNIGQTNGEEGQENIYIGGSVGTVTIKVTNQSNSSNQNLGYYANKNVKKTEYVNGEMLITYEIGVDVKSHQNEKIVLKDEITRGTEFYDLYWTYNGNSGQHMDYVNLSKESDTKKTITIGDEKGVDAGYYVIGYTASFDVGELQNAKVNSITNTITGDNNIYARTDTYTNINFMTKKGDLKNASTGEVEWTVRINDGTMPYTFGAKEFFTDTLPAGTSLVDGTMKITQYDPNWKEPGTTIDKWEAVKQQDGTTLITATLPEGTYRYKIVYKTKQDPPPQPGVVTTVVNKAEISGDIDYTTSANVTLAPAAVKKTMGNVLTKSRQYYTKPDGTKLQVMEIEWSVWLASVNAGDTYIDKGVSWAVPLLMSPEQIDGKDGKGGIVVKCEGNPNPLEKNKDYIITTPDKNEDFLFEIEFLTTQTGEVTIDYTCYADVTNVAGDGFNAYNEFGGVQAGGWLTNKFKSQSNNLFKYVKGSNASESNRITNSNIAIGTNTTLSWVIVAEPKYNPDTPLEFKDTLPKGLSFKADSLKITAEWDIDVGSQYYQYQIVKDSDGNDVITLTVDLANKQVGYKDFSNPKVTLDRLVITYDTLIEDPSDGGQSKEYTNTVEWDGNIVDQNVTVTRDVIGKNGSYDANTGMLRYSVIINPDGAKLNPGGNLLRVEDTLTDRKGIEFKLSGVTLYNLTNASDGSGKKVPGSKIADLQLLPGKPAGDDSAEKENTYYYDEDAYKFTAFISDKTACALVYEYQVMDEVTKEIFVSNKASIYGGSKSYGSTQESTKVLQYSMNASISSQAVNLSLEKHDADYYDKLLAEAEFTVSRWDESDETEGKWVEDRVYTTDANGSVALSGLKPNVLYKVEETKAPDKYAINKEIRYFMFANDSENVSIPNEVSVPDGVKNMTKKDVTIYQYGKDKDGKDIPASVMKWDDKRLGTTDILVVKKWQDGSGASITWEKGELKFDLYRKEVPKDPDYFEGKTYIYELTEDELKQIKEEYAKYKQDHADELVKEDYILTPSEEGEWELLIENLEQTDETGENVYQYYLVETSMGDTLSESDYWMGVEYKNTSGTGQYQAEITVTNTIVSDYSLPETGAEGSWTDRIIGWFQERYQEIISLF